MRIRCRRFLVMGFLLAVPTVALALNADTDYHSIRGRYFEIVGRDSASVSAVDELAKRVSEICGRYLSRLPESYTQRIFVALRPTDSAWGATEYVVRTGKAGYVRVDFNWRADLEMEAVCLGLTEAFLKSYAAFRHGFRSRPGPKYFPISALASQVYLSLRPARIADYLKELRRTGIPDIGVLMDREPDDVIESGRKKEGYWLLRCLRADGWNRDAITRLMEIGLAGSNGSEHLEKSIRSRSRRTPRETLASWWKRRMEPLMTMNTELYESTDESRAWLKRFTNFSSYRAEDHRLDRLSDLLPLRNEPALREILKARLRLIESWFFRVNPVYFNAAHSLRILYATVLEGKHADVFDLNLKGFSDDYEKAEDLHRNISEALER